MKRECKTGVAGGSNVRTLLYKIVKNQHSQQSRPATESKSNSLKAKSYCTYFYMYPLYCDKWA